MCTFARVVGAARDRNRNPFSARSSKKVPHHWAIECCIEELHPYMDGLYGSCLNYLHRKEAWWSQESLLLLTDDDSGRNSPSFLLVNNWFSILHLGRSAPFWLFPVYQNLKEYSVILKAPFYGINQKILTKKGHFQNFS